MSQPLKVVKLDEALSAEELANIKAHEASTDGAAPVDNEWLLLCEFGKAYGYEAYKAARNDEISAEEMLTMIEANRKLDYVKQFRMAEAVLAGAASAFSGKSNAFKSLTRDIINKTKVQE